MSNGIAVLLLMAAIALPYAQTLAFDRTYDDFVVVGAAPGGQQAVPSDPLGRVLRQVTFVWDRAFFGTNWGPYHLQNLGWHFATTVLTFALMRRLGIARGPALCASLLFAVLPAHTESVANLANRKEILCAAWSVACVLAWHHARNADSLAPRCVGFAASAASLVLAVLSKETAAVLPSVLIAFECGRAHGRRRLALLALFLASVVLLGVAAASRVPADLSRSSTLGGYVGEPTRTAVAIAAARTFFAHAALLVAPVDLTPDHRIAIASDVSAADIAAWTAIGALTVITLLATRGMRTVRFGLVFAILFYLPTSSLLPLSFLVAERYLYVPSIGVAIALAAAAHRSMIDGWLASLPRQRIAAGVAALLILAGALRTLTYAAHWRDESSLWGYVLARDPGSSRACLALGIVELEKGDAQAAREYLDRTIALAPNVARAWFNRSIAAERLGLDDMALADLEHTLALRPDFWPAYSNRGTWKWRKGDILGAFSDFQRALELAPEQPDLYYNRGAVLALGGELERAKLDFQRALTLDPSHAAARRNLSTVEKRLQQTASSSPPTEGVLIK